MNQNLLEIYYANSSMAANATAAYRTIIRYGHDARIRERVHMTTIFQGDVYIIEGEQIACVTENVPEPA